MKSYFEHITKGVGIFFLVDMISAFVIMLVWNTFIAYNNFPTVNFIQCLGVVVIYDIFGFVEMKRKNYNDKIDQESKQ